MAQIIKAKCCGAIYASCMFPEQNGSWNILTSKAMAKGDIIETIADFDCSSMSSCNCNLPKPKIGVAPKYPSDDLEKVSRFNDVCGVIARNYNAGLKINPAWVNEYNRLLDEMRL